MPSLSSGINLALQAVLSHSQAIQIIEHNVANADTEGYHRQSAVLSATVSNPSVSYDRGFGAGQLGTGVTVERIQRFSLDFFDGRYCNVSAATQSWEYQSQILSQMEITLSDLSDDGLAQKMDQFFLSWQNLAADPSSISLRQEVLNDSADLAEKFNRNAQQLVALQQDQNLTVKNRVEEINSLAKSIAGLNAEISKVNAMGQQPNDLLDERDQALDRLAELTGAVSSEQMNGEVTVSIGGHVLVTGHDALRLKTEPDSGNPGVDKIVWEQDSADFSPTGGELEGILKVRDFYIPQQLAELDKVAQNLVTEVNTLHQNGYTLDGSQGGDFFDPDATSALSIKLADGLTTADIAAAGTPTTSGTVENGNSENAALIVNLREKKIAGLDNQTFGVYYNGIVSNLALTTKQAKEYSSQHSVVLKALDAQRLSLTGVSLDEEAANMAKAEKAFQAAARVMNVFDEMLDLVINQMGLVGR